MEFPTIDKFAKEVAEKALDEITYEGKTVREWVEILVNQQPCEDCISRESLRRKLQEHHDFFVNAFGSYKNMTYIDKARVDEINNCIAMVVDEPSVTPQQDVGKWIKVDPLGTGDEAYMCSKCKTGDWDITIGEYKFCPYCGQKKEGGEDEEA